jgi:uncharacterized protein
MTDGAVYEKKTARDAWHGGPIKSIEGRSPKRQRRALAAPSPCARNVVQDPDAAHPGPRGDHNAGMTTAPQPAPAPLEEADIERLQALLDAVPAPLEPLDVSALDGYLCGVLLQPRPLPPAHWLPGIFDLEGRALPAGFDAGPLQALVMRRHAELDRAIGRRDWFDPWIFQLEAGASPADSVLPWVAGFAAAQERCPALMAVDDPALVEPLALLYLHFDRDDLEDADALLAVIDTLEPPADLAEAVQDVVRAVMLIADVTRPCNRPAAAPRRPRAPRPPAAGRRHRR